MVGGDVFEGCGGYEDLVSPENGETTFARRAVDARLLDDCFKDSDCGVCSVA